MLFVWSLVLFLLGRSFAQPFFIPGSTYTTTVYRTISTPYYPPYRYEPYDFDNAFPVPYYEGPFLPMRYRYPPFGFYAEAQGLGQEHQASQEQLEQAQGTN
jgi:hypothetical protein